MKDDYKLLREFIHELCNMNQSVVKKDDDGDVVIRKLVKFRKNTTRYHYNDNVDAELDPTTLDLVVNDAEVWHPDVDGKF